MKTSLLFSALTGAALAATPATSPTWQPDFNVRLRVESRDQNFTFDRGVASPTDGVWLLSRARVGLKGPLGAAISFYGQVQDSREIGSDRPSVPYILGSEGDDPLDLRQFYLESRMGDVTLRIGRQLLAFGDERLVGPVDWNNFGRSFDAVRMTVPGLGGGLDAFVSSVVQVQPAGTTGWQANHSSSDDIFAGVYSKLAASDTLKAEPYLFWRGKRKDTVYAVAGVGSARPADIPQRVVTAGLRWSGGPPDKLGGFDHDGDFAWQTGQVRGRQQVGTALVFPGPAWLAHAAWALHLGAGWSTKAPGIPVRFYAEYNHATGDQNPSDTRDESFLNLFPTNHKFYGGMDVFAWKNMNEFALSAFATIDPRTKLRIEHHVFALATTSDTWFRANAVTAVRALTPAARAASRDAGQETDLVLSRTLNARVSADCGFSYFSTGRYLAQTGGASDARFAYVQTVLQW